MKKYIVVAFMFLIVSFIIAAAVPSAGVAKEESHRHRQESPLMSKRTKACIGNDGTCSVVGVSKEVLDIVYLEYLYELELENARLEQERKQQFVAQSSAAVRNTQSFDLPAECEGKVIPAYIIMRESHCNYGAVNQNGCGGAGCFGMYQIHGMHWTSGVCSGLDWTIPADQDECASRLSSGGTNLQPWAF